MSSTGNLIALAGLLVLFFLSLRWVFGAPRPKRTRATAVVRGTRRTDGGRDRAEPGPHERR